MENSKFLDISEESCPYTIVKVKVAIAEMESGEKMDILMQEGVPCRNIPKVIEFDGHSVIDMKNNGNGTFTLRMQKAQI